MVNTPDAATPFRTIATPAAKADVSTPAERSRIRAIDWLRGLVIVLMTVDHSGAVFDAAHMHGDSADDWVVGSALPMGEFLTRWLTHLCAPIFVLLAGASLALSDAKRGDARGQTSFIVKRGLLIAAFDPLWMSLGFTNYRWFVFQVLYAIGVSMVCMAFLRKLSSTILVVGALAIAVLGEFSSAWQPVDQPWQALWRFLFLGGPAIGKMYAAYSLLPWLSVMMLGWVLGRWLLQPRTNAHRAQSLAMVGAALLILFFVVRGIDGYGNWHLHRDSADVLQWLHVSKYPPSIAYLCLELGLGLCLFALFLTFDSPSGVRPMLAPLSLLGSTAFFYYLLHVHLMAAAQVLLGLDMQSQGLLKTWGFATLTLAVLFIPCRLYLRYKAANPSGWPRYI